MAHNVLMDKNKRVYFELIKAGLWEKDVELRKYGTTDFEEIMRLAEEQSVVGLVTAGLEHVQDVKASQEKLLQFIGQTIQLEQQNTSMNKFISDLIDKLRKADIYAILVKGQGIAQCYEKPLWRASGDVDLFLSSSNYEKAKNLLMPLASMVEKEYESSKHLGITIEGWVVELHGTLQCNLSPRVKRGIQEIENDIMYGGQVRSWQNGNVQVFLPGYNEDAIYIFAHFLNHFYKEGVGLRQICDWCRLLWIYRNSIDEKKIESYIRKMGLVSEWKAFGAFAVEYMGMPVESMPMYSPDSKWGGKAALINRFILSAGNMGHNRDMNYMKKSFLIRKCYSARRRIGDLINHARIFPLDSLRFSFAIVKNGLKSAINGEG